MTDDFNTALALALRKLGQSDRFESEIRTLLKAYDPGTVEEVVTHLKEKRLLNDNKTIQNLNERNTGRRAVGKEKLRAQLERRGAPEESIDAALASSEEGEPERMDEVLRSRFKPTDSRAKAARFLFSRGFPEESIESALERFFGPPPD